MKDQKIVECFDNAIENCRETLSGILVARENGVKIQELRTQLQRLIAFVEEAKVMVSIAKRDVIIGEHQHHPELRTAAGGKPILGKYFQ